jgi:hypothetical protein
MITGICINRSGLLDALFSAAALILGADEDLRKNAERRRGGEELAAQRLLGD